MQNSVPLGEFTNYLGYLVKSTENKPLNNRPLSKSSLQINPLVDKNILGKFEATITILSYFSRLNYENKVRKVLKMYPILTYSPLVFNKALSYLTYSASTDNKIELNPTNKVASGYLLYDPSHDTPLSITVNTILGEKCLVVSFRGTLSLKSLLKDLNIVYMNLFQLYGNELFSEEFAEVQSRGKALVNPFGAHRGFVTGLQNVFPKIIEKIESLLTNHKDIKRIFITGHSLGGAYANLFSLGLAQMKKKGMILPDLHVVTFGAPKTFTSYARNVFNRLLLDEFMTLDRVTNRPRFPDPTMLTYDPIPLIPGHMEHPGFSILNPEIKTQSRTGRTKHVSELRNELSGIKSKTGFFSKLVSRNYNPLPDYPEFYSNFKDSSSLTADEYSKLLSSTVAGTVRLASGPAGKIIEIIKNIFHVSTNEITQSEKVAEKEMAEELKEIKEDPVQVPAEVVADVKAINAAVDNAYANSGDPTTPNAKEGGGSNSNLYKQQTVKEDPNHLVYSCSQITAPIPMVGCHLGYMGVGWVGGTHNAGSGNPASRGYSEEATLYYTDGNWTFSSDIPKTNNSKTKKINISRSPPAAPAAPTAPAALAALAAPAAPAAPATPVVPAIIGGKVSLRKTRRYRKRKT